MKIFDGFFEWNKPGKGVDPKANANKFTLFFILLYEKITKIMLLNFIGFILFLPLLSYFTIRIAAIYSTARPDALLPDTVQMLIYFPAALPNTVQIVLMCLSVLLYGPYMAGMTYVFRNISRQEHAFIIYDCFSQAWKNAGKSIVVGLVDLTVLYCLIVCIGIGLSGAGVLFIIMIAFAVFVWQCVKPYVFIQIVTFELSLVAIMRNALLFVLIGIKNNLIALGGSCIILIASLLVPLPIFPLFTIGVSVFLTTYCAYGVIEKNMDTTIPDRTNKKEETSDEQ